MTISVEEYQRLKRREDDCQSQSDRLEGAISQQREQLKKNFNLENKQDAVILEKELQEQIEQELTIVNKLKKEFEEEFGERLK